MGGTGGMTGRDSSQMAWQIADSSWQLDRGGK